MYVRYVPRIDLQQARLRLEEQETELSGNTWEFVGIRGT